MYFDLISIELSFKYILKILLLNKLYVPAIIGDNFGSSTGIEHLLELLHDRRRHLEDLWLQRKIRLEQHLQLCQLDVEVNKVRGDVWGKCGKVWGKMADFVGSVGKVRRLRGESRWKRGESVGYVWEGVKIMWGKWEIGWEEISRGKNALLVRQVRRKKS